MVPGTGAINASAMDSLPPVVRYVYDYRPAPGSREAVAAQNRLDTVGSTGLGIFPSYMGAAP